MQSSSTDHTKLELSLESLPSIAELYQSPESIESQILVKSTTVILLSLL